MGLPLYLAMTAGELERCEKLPHRLGWMACHFSPYGTGISNCPAGLPEMQLLILNDRTPVCGHDPATVAKQLGQVALEVNAAAVLLDLQRPGCPDTAMIVTAIIEALHCPVVVTPDYAWGLPCPVFLPPPPLHIPLGQYLAPWQDREIWLEAARTCECFTVTTRGSRCTDALLPEDLPWHMDTQLHCKYHVQVEGETARFTLWRDDACLKDLWEAAAGLGVAACVGLYQELKMES